jgi:hypothetical protein
MVERRHLNEAREPKTQGTTSKLENFTFTKATIYFSNPTSND